MATRDTYTKQTWENLPSEETPISAERLDHIEQGIKDAADKRAMKEIYDDTAISLGRKQNSWIGYFSVAEGNDTIASGSYSHAEGKMTNASNTASHAEGYNTAASGYLSHAEGYNTAASGDYAHAEGSNTVAKMAGHAEGYESKAFGIASHTEGYQCITGADGDTSHGRYSHAEGMYTIAAGESQHVSGKYNVQDDNNQYAIIVGGGISQTDRKNIHTLDWTGNAYYAGDVTTQFGTSLNTIGTAESVDIDFSKYFT